MQKRKMVSAAWLALSVFFYMSCESGTISEKKEPAQAQGDRGPAADPKSCVGIKSLDVLQDGRTALSYISGSKKVLWNIQNSKLIAKDIPVNFNMASFDGRTGVGKVSGSRHQVFKLVDQRYETIMLIEVLGDARFYFSIDSKVLAVHYGLPSGIDQVDIYDLESRALVNSHRASGIRFVRLAQAGQSLIIGYDYGWGKSIGKYRVDTMEEDFLIKLPSYLRFSYLEVSKNAIIAKVRSSYRTYSLESGDYLGSHYFGSIYAVDPQRDIVLSSSSWGSLEVREVVSGDVVYSDAFPEEAILSSCAFSSKSSIVCLKKGSNQVLKVDFRLGASALKCY